MKVTLLAYLFAASAAAANIAVYRGAGCSGASALCKNVKPMQCCHFPSGGLLRAADFINIPNNDLGGTFKRNGTVICNTNTGYKLGSGCATGTGQGASYHCCAGKARDSPAAVLDAWHCTGSVAADVAVFSGHYFDMGSNVPAKDARKLEALIMEDATYNDVPEYLMKYEVEEP